MSNPRQMFDHVLNPIKGWPSPYAVDCRGQFYVPFDGSDSTRINAGAVVSFDTAHIANGVCPWIKGGVGDQPAIFLVTSNYDPDVTRDGGGFPGGYAVGLPATACYELETTEYNGTITAGQWLTSYTYNASTNAAHIGKITSLAAFDKSDMATAEVCNVVGFCTQSTRANEFGVNVVKFWTHFIPNTILPA